MSEIVDGNYNTKYWSWIDVFRVEPMPILWKIYNQITFSHTIHNWKRTYDIDLSETIMHKV